MTSQCNAGITERSLSILMILHMELLLTPRTLIFNSKLILFDRKSVGTANVTTNITYIVGVYKITTDNEINCTCAYY